jgi:hypothetical protein
MVGGCGFAGEKDANTECGGNEATWLDSTDERFHGMGFYRTNCRAAGRKPEPPQKGKEIQISAVLLNKAVIESIVHSAALTHSSSDPPRLGMDRYHSTFFMHSTRSVVTSHLKLCRSFSLLFAPSDAKPQPFRHRRRRRRSVGSKPHHGR